MTDLDTHLARYPWMKETVAPLNSCQLRAINLLLSNNNVFLTGAAGTGKTYVLRCFIEAAKRMGMHVPVVASTGAAAILAGGQTFHRFFGLNVATDIEALVKNALEPGKTSYLYGRIGRTQCIILDEVSMLPDYALEAAYLICQRIKKSTKPWGGIKVIAVGDFRQLPPVVKGNRGPTPWSFLSPAWEESGFKTAMLTTPVRAVDAHFVEILNDARLGKISPRIKAFLDSKTVGNDAPDEYPRLYGKKIDVENHNIIKLGQLPGKEQTFWTEYSGNDHYVDSLKKEAPVPEALILKVGARIMMRQNDKDDRWVNGSLGHITDITHDSVSVKLVSGGQVSVPQSSFMYNNEMGDVLATGKNFPMTLAWATTIHKSQGATMDRILVDLRRLWEPGQLYVALSRVRSPDGVRVVQWDEKAFKIDKKVSEFHKKLLGM